MNQEKPLAVRPLVLTALLTALMAVGSYIVIPMVPVPLVLGNAFVLLAGLVLPLPRAAASVGLYLLLGILGLPVFSGGGSGPAHLLGPTGGYLIGYLAAAPAMAALVRRQPRRLFRTVPAVLLGIALIYACGVPWLKISQGLTWSQAAGGGALPFLPGDLLKAAAAVTAARLTPEDLWDSRPS